MYMGKIVTLLIYGIIPQTTALFILIIWNVLKAVNMKRNGICYLITNCILAIIALIFIFQMLKWILAKDLIVSVFILSGGLTVGIVIAAILRWIQSKK